MVTRTRFNVKFTYIACLIVINFYTCVIFYSLNAFFFFLFVIIRNLSVTVGRTNFGVGVTRISETF